MASLGISAEAVEVVDLTIDDDVEEQKPRIVARSSRQQELANLLERFGVAGLADEVVRLAKEEKEKKNAASWRKFLDVAGGATSWVDIYLSSMDPNVLDAIIRGDLTSRKYQDISLDNSFAKRHQMRENLPQIYLSISCRRKITDKERDWSRVRKVAGCGPSLSEMLQILSTMRSYTNQSADSTMVLKIDTAFAGWTRDNVAAGNVYGRRYLTSNTAKDRIVEWLDQAQSDMQRSSQNGASRDEPLSWCLSEVGFGVRGFRRSMQHRTHEGTNYLFGLYTAVLEYLFPKEFDISTVAMMDVLFPEHADFCEVLGSMLVGSYAMHGGLNPVLAGGADLSRGSKAINRPELDTVWADVRLAFEKKDVWEKVRKVEAAKTEALRKTTQQISGISAAEADIARANQALLEERRQLEESQEQVRQLQEIEDLDLSFE
ncbi:hypothetical protein LTR70_009086 [Exophiala xenobiotica]|uniref:Uncharacterized protein n=1 Tax=Lithohypha guttulata TaxID=1690604 RepID=A0ABR0JVG8_9EURO|nr:hypothetical protein LTR24_010027 [Lithohypha guttulata]KAK5311006.1 hypothetical protein LTR70_009086 [Exophiala xenobiotica]